jgi:hypothetical protein
MGVRRTQPLKAASRGRKRFRGRQRIGVFGERQRVSVLAVAVSGDELILSVGEVCRAYANGVAELVRLRYRRGNFRLKVAAVAKEQVALGIIEGFGKSA